MTITRQSRHFITGLFLVAAVFLSGFSSAINRDNSEFINDSFWAQSPTSGDIIDAVFGNSNTPEVTAYTQHWDTNTCTGTSMSVVYVAQNDLGVLLPTRDLAANTIYVLTGDQEISDQINTTGPCIAVLGSGDITLTNNFPAFGNHMIYDVFDSTIIDGVTMDGLGLFDIGNGIYQDSNNNTLHNIKVHSFDSFGINYNNSQYTSLYNSSIFNNSSDGIFMANTEYATIDNVYVFDNLFIGIYITNASRHNTIQNSIIFNNTYAGIRVVDVSEYNNFYNLQVFNNQNGSNGIGLEITNSNYNVIQGSQIYNNYIQGIRYEDVTSGLILNTAMYNHRRNIWLDNTNIDIADVSLLNRSTNGLYATNASNITHYADMLGGLSFTRFNTTNAINLAGGSTLTTGDSISSNGLFNTGAIKTNTYNPSCGRMGYPVGSSQSLYDCLDNGSLFLPIVNPLAMQPVFAGIGSENQRSSDKFFFYSGTDITYIANPYTDHFIGDNSIFGPFSSAIVNSFFVNEGIVYTSGTTIPLYIGNQNAPFHYTFTGDISTSVTGTVTTATNTAAELTGTDGMKVITGYLYANTGYYSGLQSHEYVVMRYLDTTAPDAPVLLSPLSGSMFTGDQIDLLRDPAVDTGAGVSGYNYQVATDSGFTNLLFYGSTTDTGVSLTGVGFYPNYYRQVQAVDNLGQASGWATTGAFHYGFDSFDIAIGNTTFPTNSGQDLIVTAYDIDGNIITGYNNPVTFSITGIVPPTNPNAPYNDFTLPANYQFTTADTGVHTFTGGVVVTYPGVYEITVQDAIAGTQLGTTIAFTVVGEAPDMFSGTLSVVPAATSGDISITISGSQYPIDYDLGGGAITPQNGTVGTSVTIAEDLTSLPNADGSYDIVVTISDGGFYTYTMTSTVILDTVDPVIAITAPVTGSYSSVNQPWIERTTIETGAGMSGYVVVMSGTSLVYTATNQTSAAYRQSTALADGVRTMIVYGYDEAGNMGTASTTFTIDNTAPVIVSGYPNQVVIANPFTFSWNVVDTGGVQSSNFMLRDFYGNPILTSRANILTTSVTPLQLGLGSAIAPGIYKREVEVTDNVGLSTNSPEYVFGIHNAIPGQIQGFMELQSSFGNIVSYGGNIYTNTTQLQAALFSNIATNVTINGNINPTIVGVPLLMPFPYTLQAINLTPGDGAKNINALFSMGNINPYSVAKQVILDTTAPIAPTLTAPVNGSLVTDDIVLSRSGASDAGAGIKQYDIQLSTGQTFPNILRTGTTTNQTYTITGGTLSTGTYYRKVITTDRVGNSSTSTVESFVVTTTGQLGNGATPNTFSISPINNALTSLLYRSEPVVVAGLTNGQRANVSVSQGVLIKNGTAIGTTGTAVNGDIFEIDLISSSNYNTEVASTLTIGTKSAIYRLRTQSSNYGNNNNGGLTNSQRLQIRIIFDALVDSYRDDESRALAFFQTLANSIESMLDRQNLSNLQEQALEYFLSLINDYIDELGGSNSLDGATYTAPNGRVFRISYDSVRIAYTSPDFLKPAFFASFTAFRTHIDRNNPGYTQGFVSGGSIDELSSAYRGSNVLVTPNNKVYRIEQKSNGKRYSPDMLFPKEFDTQEGLRSYLIANNR